MSKARSGRFTGARSAAFMALNSSLAIDWRLWPEDIEGSAAHARALRRAGVIADDELRAIEGGLARVADEVESGAFVPRDDDEDVHMAIERRATELAGDIGAKMHTARSRNDQVATTLRLYTRDALDGVAAATLDMVEALIEVGEKFPDAYLPGYTHLQRAQPVMLSHHLHAHAFALLRDVDRLSDARARVNVSPLGAGALAGTSLAIDPEFTARLLGFDETFANSMDAVSDRDFVAETLFDLAMLGIHLSRMGEELVLWTSAEFNFAALGDEFTTGSSMLPQKKNSDVAELARGKSGRLVGNLTGLLVTLKGLPLSYNRDLQEDKEPLFDSVRQILLILAAMTGAYRSMTFNTSAAQSAADDQFLVATDVAERLVEQGVPFRQAHEQVGRLVAESVARQIPFGDVVAEHEETSTFAHLFDTGHAVGSRTSPGAAGPNAQERQKQRLRDAIAQASARLS